MPVKILTFSTLYPNNAQNRNGIFVETRLRHLLKDTDVESKVMAPVPWFPSTHQRFGQYATFAKVSATNNRHDIAIQHPKYPIIPKIGMIFTPFFLALFSWMPLKKLIKSGYDFDVIDAHYFYPDGVAAIMLGKLVNKPVTITARGTDISLIPQYTIPRKLIQWAIKNAAHMMTVCEALRQSVIELGATPESVSTLRNGVDLELFTPHPDREGLRNTLGISGKTIISAGHLIERKGNHLIIQSLPQLPDVTLLIAGDGEEEKSLKQLADEHGVTHQIKFLGALTQSELRDYFSACDALVLASSREGWANVLLESMACGTPVVATSIWGTPEVVQNDTAGTLVDRTVESITQGIEKELNKKTERTAVRHYAERFNWLEISQKQQEIFSRIKKTVS